MVHGAGFLAIWSDVERASLTDYRHWLTREHTTERVTTKGFLACRVFHAVRADIERFFIRWKRRRSSTAPPPSRVSTHRPPGRNVSCPSLATSFAAAAL